MQSEICGISRIALCSRRLRIGGSFACVHNVARVLGIETSCDDTAVCVLTSRREVLSSRRYADRGLQQRLGGICPAVVANQHRTLIDRFVDECLIESNINLSDLDAVAVTTKPGLVIALRVGVDKAVSLARKGRIPLIPVHHMQAHATVANLIGNITYPYVSVLISGAHAIIALTDDPSSFNILLTCSSGSPGECFDKIGRELKLDEQEFSDIHPGAAVEQMASRASPNGYLKYPINMEKFENLSVNFNFSWIKSAFLTIIHKGSKIDKPDFCASVQHAIGAYLAAKLRKCLQFLNETNKIPIDNRNVFLSGGVASNKYIHQILKNACGSEGYALLSAPPQYCSDNAEMVAWNGIQLLTKRSNIVMLPDDIPSHRIHVSARCPIGNDCSALLQAFFDSRSAPTESN